MYLYLHIAAYSGTGPKKRGPKPSPFKRKRCIAIKPYSQDCQRFAAEAARLFLLDLEWPRKHKKFGRPRLNSADYRLVALRNQANDYKNDPARRRSVQAFAGTIGYRKNDGE